MKVKKEYTAPEPVIMKKKSIFQIKLKAGTEPSADSLHDGPFRVTNIEVIHFFDTPRSCVQVSGKSVAISWQMRSRRFNIFGYHNYEQCPDWLTKILVEANYPDHIAALGTDALKRD